MEVALVQAVSSNHQLVDEEVQRDIGVQEHAAAVQLLNRSLALAHLRAELVKPRGRPMAAKPTVASAAVKQEPGLVKVEAFDDMQTEQDQPQAWQMPQQPQQPQPQSTYTNGPASAWALEALQAIASTVTNTAGIQPDSMQQPQQQTTRRHMQGGSWRHASQFPDPVAAAKWQLQAEQDASPDVLPLEVVGSGTETSVKLQAAPRIRADPVLRAQQLAGWIRLGADGAPEAAGQAGTQDAAGMDVSQTGDDEQPGDEDEFMEEEWV